jgi:hypothetical protein
MSNPFLLLSTEMEIRETRSIDRDLLNPTLDDLVRPDNLPIITMRIIIPVDPAGGYRYWNPIKPCESRDFGSRQTSQ